MYMGPSKETKGSDYKFNLERIGLNIEINSESHVLVAQLVERMAVNHDVRGSSPLEDVYN